MRIFIVESRELLVLFAQEPVPHQPFFFFFFFSFFFTFRSLEVIVAAHDGPALAHGAEVVLVVEGAIEKVQELVGDDTGIDRLLAIPRMPTDVRHNAKIDYAKLQRWLRRHG